MGGGLGQAGLWGLRQNQAWSGVAALLTHDHVGLSSELGERATDGVPGSVSKKPSRGKGLLGGLLCRP